MPDVWSEILQECKLGDLVLPVASVSRAGGFDFARQRYPFRPGQDVEDTGRMPTTFSLRVPLFAGMRLEGGDELYPARYEELLFLLNDSARAGEVEYVDPVLGTYRVKVARWNNDDTSTERDGSLFTIELEERIAEEASLRLTLSETGGNAQSRAAELGEEVDAGLEEQGVTKEALDEGFRSAGYPLEGDEKDWPDGEVFASAVSNGFAALNAGALAVDDAAAQVDRFTARVDAVLAFDALEALDAWSVRSSLVRLRETFARAAERVVSSDSRRLTTFTTQGTTSIYRIARDLYGDARQADALLRLNALANPLAIPAGTVLRVWVP